MSRRTISVRANAKVNWTLELLRRRDDGYHEIKTVMQPVTLADELTVSAGDDADDDGISLSATGRWDVPAGDDNLCLQAAEAFAKAFKITDGIRIHLHKRIPVGAGLGGGSSDCVAVLASLARLYNVEDDAAIRKLAMSLGSDTTFFLYGGPAVCTGRGEKVRTLNAHRRYQLVIARPFASVSTPEAYSMLTADEFTSGKSAENMAAALEAGIAPQKLAPNICNAFTEKVTKRYREIRRLMADMKDCELAAVEMTGSGAGVFGLAMHRRAARNAASELRAKGYWAEAVNTIQRGYLIRDGCASDA